MSMHLEVLIEDSSGAALLKHLLPAIIGPQGDPHTWRVHPYKGIGHIPKGLIGKTDPAKRVLLDQLPRLLRGCRNTPGIDAVVVVVDSDRRDCAKLLDELREVAEKAGTADTTLFRIALEEAEAWYFGDRVALLKAYPRAKLAALEAYKQDTVCGTWEMLADATHKGGAAAIKKVGFWQAGTVKHEWANTIGPLMDIESNQSPSFGKLRDGLRRIVGIE